MAEASAALHVAGSVPARNKYLDDLQVDVPVRVIFACEFKRTHEMWATFLFQLITFV